MNDQELERLKEQEHEPWVAVCAAKEKYDEANAAWYPVSIVIRNETIRREIAAEMQKELAT